MSERPILFSAPMVRALLDGRKTQTRRVIRPWWPLPERTPAPDAIHPDGSGLGWVAWWSQNPPSAAETARLYPGSTPHGQPGAYGQPGDLLWVRETWAEVPWVDADGKEGTRVLYRADEPGKNTFDPERGDRWKPSIHMPRRASRITLRVTNVRVEKLQDISPEDAEAEGVFRHIARHSIDKVFRDERGATAIARFRELWDSINAKRAPWESNPWVWVVTFEVVG